MKQMNIDAFIFIDSDFGYISSFTIGGTGEGRLVLDNTINILTKNGSWAVSEGQADAHKESYSSNKKIEMKSYFMVFTSKELNKYTRLLIQVAEEKVKNILIEYKNNSIKTQPKPKKNKKTKK